MKKDIVVSCPIKNDNEYLKEYVDHYLNLGFDKIYFYDNNDDPLIQPIEVLKEYIDKGYVVIIDYRDEKFDDTLTRRHFVLSFDFEWVLFVDDDEFLELVKHNNILEFINSFNDDVTKIAINNLHFGDNEQLYYKPIPVKSRFKNPLPRDSNSNGLVFNSAIKSLIKNKDISINYLNAHSLLDQRPYYNADHIPVTLELPWKTNNDEVTYDTAYIKHYCTKSLEEFIKCKMKRSNNIIDHFKDRFGLDNYYFMYNKKTKEKEKLIEVFTKKYLQV